MLFTFWLVNALGATAAYHFSTSELQKVVRICSVLYILTRKCASRQSGVQFFQIQTSKSGPSLRCFVHFDLKICFAPQRHAIFRHLDFQKWAKTVSFLVFWLANVLRATAACHFSTSQLPKVVRTLAILWMICVSAGSKSRLAKAAGAEVAAQSRQEKLHAAVARSRFEVEKTQRLVTFLTFHACCSSFYWLSRNCIFFLLTLLLFSAFHLCPAFQLSILSEVSLLNFLWWSTRSLWP